MVFDQCTVSWYSPGAGIGWHSDAPIFGACIAGVSLGAMVKMSFRPLGARQASYVLPLAPGSLYAMRGEARWKYEHRIAPVRAERFSLTFRSVGSEAS